MCKIIFDFRRGRDRTNGGHNISGANKLDRQIMFGKDIF